jgi:hypothetical protein
MRNGDHIGYVGEEGPVTNQERRSTIAGTVS